jgi:tetratricopeptide (TPR) repeat protein
MTCDDGLILINDYGQTMMSREDEFEHQRFSMATFVGVNFPLLERYFNQPNKGHWIQPHDEAGGIHSRLLCHKRVDKVITTFWERFSKAAYDHLHEPIELARTWARSGRFEMASSHYAQALERQPWNWVLLNEISMFLTFSLGDPKSGIEQAKTALALNPTCSAELWNTLGDGLYEFGRVEEARSAYLKALTVNETDVRAHFNLAFCHLRLKNFDDALRMLAEALALDRTGEYRERLIRKLQEVMEFVERRHRQMHLLLLNLVSKYSRIDETGKDKPGEQTENQSRPQR